MANTTVKGKFNVVAENGDVQTIYPKTTGDQVLVDRSSNASVIPNDVANLQHIVNKMGSLALKSKVETSDFTTGTMIGVAGTGNDPCANLKANTDAGKIADALIVKNIESRVDTLENSNLVTVDELDAGLATKPDTEINDSVTSTSLTWSSKKLSDQLTELNSNTNLLTNRVNTLTSLPEGSTTNDARLEDICNGYDNTTVYTSPGDAVRTQISDLHDNLFDFFNTSCDYYEIITLNNSGFLSYGHPLDIYPSDSITSYHTKVIPVISGDVYMYYGRGDSAAYSVFWFNKNMEPLNYEQYNTTMSDTYIAITVPINATYAIFQSLTNELKLYNTTRGINSVYKNIDDVNKKISEVRKDNIYFYNFTTSGNFNYLQDLCCFLDIPISKKGKLIIHCVQIYRNGNEIKPTKVYILKKVSTTQMYVIDVVDISNDMITDMCYIPNHSAKWITIDTGYYLSGDNDYYVGNNCIIYNTSINGDDNSSVENYAGYYSGVGNFEDICYKGNTFQLKDGGVPRTNSALMIYPEIISWEFIQDIPSKVSDLQNDLLFISTKWNNKIGDFLGDSITAQNQYTNKLNFLYGITVNNYGVSGSCISNILNAYYTPFYERVSSMNTDCDFVFMFGGTNDWGKNCPLGTKSDTEPNTFYGALYTTLTALRTRFPTKPIFVCTILQRNYNYRENMENNSNGNSIEEFNIAIKYMARKFGCIIIDLWQCGIYPDINGSTYMTDGVHINNVGGTRVAMFIKDSMERYTPY